MQNFLQREVRLIGTLAVEKLISSKVLVCGLGGVGAACVEALTRAGIGNLIIIDNDKINETNINRQLIATYETIGENKTDACEKRLKSINPELNLVKLCLFLTPENVPEIIQTYSPDYIVDCIDNVSAKISLAMYCDKNDIKLLSCMGTGNKLNPLMLKFSDIYKTNICPLCKVMRKELKTRNISKLCVLYSEEQPIKMQDDDARTPASISFVPPTAGFILCSKVICDLIDKPQN